MRYNIVYSFFEGDHPKEEKEQRINIYKDCEGNNDRRKAFAESRRLVQDGTLSGSYLIPESPTQRRITPSRFGRVLPLQR